MHGSSGAEWRRRWPIFIMIAHRLKIVRNADQILVVDGGRIVQRGKHEELIGQKDIYADFVLGRKEAISWSLD